MQPATPAPWLRDRQYHRTLRIMVYTLVLIMILPDGLDYTQLNTAAGPSSGSRLYQILWLLLLGSSCWIILRRGRLARVYLRQLNPFLPLFALLILASILWSAFPGITLRRLLRFTTITLVAVSFTLASWHTTRFQDVLRPILTAVLAGSVIFGILRPDLAIHQSTSAELVGAWRGLATHKNGFGALAAIGFLLWLHAGLSREVRALPASVGVVLALLCLHLSRSSTSLMTSIVAGSILVLAFKAPGLIRRGLSYVIALYSLAFIGYGVALYTGIPIVNSLLSPVTGALGKEATLTGRSDIWHLLMPSIAQHPILGTGYGAFWTGPEAWAPCGYITNALLFYPASGHSGYLDILNELGTVGFLLLIGYLVVYLTQCAQLRHVQATQGTLYLALLIQQLVCNFSETRWMSYFSVDFVFMALATTSLARGLLEHRMQQVYGAPAESAPAQRGASQALQVS